MKKNPSRPKWENGSHYWGEPEIGYYLNTENWAIRKHAYQLSDAGVDVIIIDVTNDRTYPEVYLTICDVFEEMRKEGETTPAIAFLASEISANILWDDFYSKELYKELWFRWKGKPLLLYGQHEIPSRHLVNDIEFSEDIKAFFTLKQSWAWTTLPWYNNGKDEWPWVDHFPQAIAWSDSPEEKEMVPVSVAQHPLSNIGRSFHNFHQPDIDEFDVTPVTDQGLYFQEQWDWALQVDPEFVFVTGWNEWSAGKQLMGANISNELQQWKFYPGAHLGKVGKELHPGDAYFIDQYNQEYSRDIEPMHGGHNDNYYYQLMANIRRYKGMDTPQLTANAKTIDLLEDFKQWNNISPVFKDHFGDTTHRKSEKQGNAGPYINTQGRNDILETRVTFDSDNLYFYVKTAKQMTPPNTSQNWMHLLIDADQNDTTGWNGYDFMLNGNNIHKETTPMMKYDREQGEWLEVSKLPYKMVDNEFMVSIPRKFIASNSIYFHWVDNPKQLKTINDLFDAGDNAPERRAKYKVSFIK